MNLFIKQTHRFRKLIYGYQREKVTGRDRLKFGIDLYTLLNLRQITNKDLLSSTGISAQYSVITKMGKEFEKE